MKRKVSRTDKLQRVRLPANAFALHTFRVRNETENVSFLYVACLRCCAVTAIAIAIVVVVAVAFAHNCCLVVHK